MLSKNKIREIQSLKFSKFRRQFKLFIAEGPKTVIDLLNSRFKANAVYYTEEAKEVFSSEMIKDITSGIVSLKELERISQFKTPNQVVALFHFDEDTNGPPARFRDLIFILDGISDPGNLGTIIRTADWFGVETLVCSENCVDVYNPKVVQASMGSIARVRTYYTDLNQYLEQLSGTVEIIGTTMKGTNIYEYELPSKAAVLIGNESHGISQHLYQYLNTMITIPSFSGLKKQGADSLNASIAAAIIASEFRRQKGFN
jgi:TrmH family RNA methyltransferase